jgi:hypothetical protein
MCPECDRLWREIGEVAQRNFRLEERLRHAAVRQDHELTRVLSEKLSDLAQEQAAKYQALSEHEAEHDGHKRPPSVRGD